MKGRRLASQIKPAFHSAVRFDSLAGKFHLPAESLEILTDFVGNETGSFD